MAGFTGLGWKGSISGRSVWGANFHKAATDLKHEMSQQSKKLPETKRPTVFINTAFGFSRDVDHRTMPVTPDLASLYGLFCNEAKLSKSWWWNKTKEILKSANMTFFSGTNTSSFHSDLLLIHLIKGPFLLVSLVCCLASRRVPAWSGTDMRPPAERRPTDPN